MADPSSHSARPSPSTPTSSRAQVQPADPLLRRRALAMGLLAVVAAGAAIAALPGWLEGYVPGLLEASPAQRTRVARALALATAVAVGIPLLLLGGYLRRLGRRIQAAGRHPPPQMRVVVDTPILTGPAALAHASRLRRAGWLCTLAGPALGAWSYARLGALAALLGVR